MDFNELFNKVIEEGVLAKKEELTKLVLEERNLFLKEGINKNFGEAYNSLNNVLRDYKVPVKVGGRMFEIFQKLLTEIWALVEAKPTTDTKAVIDEEEEEVITDNDTIVTVDNEKRIVVPTSILDLADFPIVATAKILKDEDTNTVYIVNREYFDKNKTFIKYRNLDEGSFKIGVGTLLDVEPGDNVLIRVPDDQTITLNKINKNTTHSTKSFRMYTDTAIVTKDSRITIPNYILSDANLEGKDLYIKVSEEGEVLIAHDDIEDFGVGEVITINRTRFVRPGESLRLGMTGLLGSIEGDEIGIDVYKNKIILHYN